MLNLLPLLMACGEQPTPPDLYINEFMADNQSTISNEDGEYSDWIELFNAGDEPISTGNLYLSDNLDNPTAHRMADLEIAPGGYLLIWADNALDLGDYHVSFRLEKDGEAIGLSMLDDANEPILLDGVEFDAMAEDTSWGRLPDGGDWQTLDNPTPGSENR